MISLNPPYKKDLPVSLNEFGIPAKSIYRNEDLAKILKVSPATIQWRCNRQKYGAIKKDTAGRRYFTLDDLRRIVAQERATNTFGLPDKPFYTVGDLAFNLRGEDLSEIDLSATSVLTTAMGKRMGVKLSGHGPNNVTST